MSAALAEAQKTNSAQNKMKHEIDFMITSGTVTRFLELK
jgi:hypothetical protein